MSNIKDHFVSRWDDGVLIELDWQSLEVVVFAWLTKDPTLYKLIRNNIDMHRYVGALFYNKPMEEITKEERTEIKPGNFELIYGGSPYSLVYNKGMELEEARKLYDSFWSLFPTAKMNYDNLFREVESRKYLIDEYTPRGVQKHESYYITPTGRKCFFKTYDNTPYQIKKGNLTRFKYAEVVNYRGQSLATADIHIIALGMLFREAINHREKFLLINTVHDSVLIDCKEKYLDNCIQMCKNILESVVTRLKDKFNIIFDLPLTVDVKYGRSWGEMNEYKVLNKIRQE